MSTDIELVKASCNFLKREVTIEKVLSIVRGAELSEKIDMGRYQFLWEALNSNDEGQKLLRDLETQNASRIMLHWEKFTRSDAGSPEFLRGIALMHWEWALEYEEEGNRELSENHYQRAKFFWLHVMGSRTFWRDFSERYSIDEEQQKELRKRIYDAILQHHQAQARAFCSGGNISMARLHFNCLCGWNVLNGREVLGIYSDDLLDQEWDEIILREIDDEAELLINRWVSDQLREATRVLDNPDIDKLSYGINKDYRGGIQHIRPLLRISPDNQRYLRFLVNQYNNWCYHMFVAEQHKQASDIAKQSIDVVDALKKHLKKGEYLKPENQAVSLNLMLRGLLKEGTEEAGALYTEAIEWDPKNSRASDFLGQIETRICLEKASDNIEAERFEEALDCLEQIKGEDAGSEVVTNLRTRCHFNWSAYLLNKEDDPEGAMKHIEIARELDPENSVIQESYEILQLKVAERPYELNFRSALEHFENEEYQKAVDDLQGIPETFSQYEGVRQLEAGCYFRRAIEMANRGQHKAAVGEMEVAARLEPDNEVIQRQLRELRRLSREGPYIRSSNQAMELFKQKKYEEALDMTKSIPQSFSEYQYVVDLRAACHFEIAIKLASEGQDLHSAVDHLEEAARLNPTNKNIEEQLIVLKLQVHIKDKKYEEALKVDIPWHLRDKEQIKKIQAICHFNLGVELANENSDYRTAERHLEQARQLDPEEEIIEQQLGMIRRMAQDKPYVDDFKSAQQLFEREKYKEALRKLDRIPHSFSLYDQLKELQAACHFRMGIEAANRKNLDNAIKELEAASRILDRNSPSAETVEKQLEELRKVKSIGGFAALEKRNKEIEKHNQAFETAKSVVDILNNPANNPISPELALNMLQMLEQAVEDSDHDPQIVALRDQLRNALGNFRR